MTALIRQAAIAVLVMSASADASPTTETARHLRLDREHSFTIPPAPADAFPLFEPVGEKCWAENWHPVFASPEDALLHDGSVFTVAGHGPDGTALPSVWTVSRYDPPRLIEYRNVLPGFRATQVTVRCDPVDGGQTRVMVRYVYHGLSAAGDQYLATITPEAFRANIDGWGAAIRAWLGRGTPATP